MRPKTVLLTAIVIFTIAEIVALSPSSVDEVDPTVITQMDPGTLLSEGARTVKTLAPGIPKSRVPEDTVEQFNYVSSQGTEKQWNLLANEAVLFRSDKLVHARGVKALLFDPDGKTTTITGLEAKYFMNQKDLEVFGSVKTVFSDGFVLNSEYLRYRPGLREIEIPVKYFVTGEGQQQDGRIIHFESHGFYFQMAKSEIVLSQNVHFMFERSDHLKTSDSPTDILSDHCLINRDSQIAHFTMFSSRPLEKRFVHVKQPGFSAKSRRTDFNYGNESKLLQYMTLYDDVFIKDLDKDEGLKYGTAGRADFDSRRNVIVLTEFPQVYQDSDTVTGDRIVVHRDSDVVEVENSNAFSTGSNGE